MRALVVGASIVALAAVAEPAAAQTTIGWDASLFSSYVWRGLHLSGKPVVQPDLYVTVPLGKASLTAGGWGNIELGKYDPPAIGEGGGRASLDLTEFDWWGEISLPAGIATLTAGATGYIFPNDAGLTSDNNTVEVYGKIALEAPLSPKVSAYYDVDKVKGAYIEGSISHGLSLSPAFTLNLGALAGLSAGQECEGGDALQGTCTNGFNFAENGFTHLDLSASSSFSAGALSITPSFHFVVNNDDLTKFTKLNKDHDVKVWGGVTISWSKGFGGKAEE